ncbi:tetratricopeptide repeat-containing serine protease family protein [Streptomyces sp. NPDC052682]|uniref:tetratricopeptide repeat-containing serine protease family protein n=1 Tax=Streptomyces sp. NPDC052682 TaxID=3154954 RepID=UPI00344137E5
MEFDRRAQIRVSRAGTKGRGFGSGYLIAPRLVLTAAHVLEGMDQTARDPVTVCLPDTGAREFPATVRWQRWDEKVDAALIEVRDGDDWQTPQSLADLLARPPQRYGLLIGTRPHPVTATGFPRMQKDPDDGRRLDEQLTGRITPGTGALASRYEISSTDPTPGTGSFDDSRWAGISGAALLTDDGLGGDMLCGVIRRDRQAGAGARLTATPAAHLLNDTDFRALVTEHTGWEPVLEPVEPAALLTPAASERLLDSPASLLRADAEAVTFHGRDSELTDLHAWCQDDPPTIAVQVWTGPGGQGKTRLARRLTDLLSHHGWATGHLRPDLTDHDTPPDFTPLITALPLLIVVDYAETRPRLLRRLITCLHRSRHRVRLLLLARSDGEWRTDATLREADAATRRLLKEAHPIELAPLIPRSRPAQDRRTAFADAAGDLARLLLRVHTVPDYDWSALAAALQPPDDLSHPRYDNALTLQLTALVTLLQHGPKPADASPGTPAEEILLEHEGSFWEASAQAPAFKLNLPTTTLATAVAVAALCGATTTEAATHVLRTVADLPADKTARTAAWLARLYPAEPGRYWGSLQPDRVAEYHASQILEEDGIALPALLAAGTPAQQGQIITVLARAVIAHYNAGRTKRSEHLLRTMDTTLASTTLSYQGIQTATAALPHPSRITAPLALRLTSSLAQANGQLAQADPDVYEPDLASSLSNLGIRLSEAGRRSEALAAGQEAVEIYHRLAADNPSAYEPDLAGSLSNLGIRLSQAGRWSEALAATEEAVEIRRRLVADNPSAYEPDLARSLSNLGNRLSEAGRWSEALAAGQEAVEIYHRLVADNPAAYEPDLAGSLSNLGIRLSEAGRRSEALAAEQKAVEIRRRLAADNPAAYEPDLASSLSNLGIRLAEAGRRSEALTAEQKAVEIRRRLAADNPAAYEPDLAGSLSNLGARLAEAGRWSEALAAAEEAVEIYHRLAADNPAAYERDLAGSLSNLGARLAEAGRRSEALAAAEEAVEIYHRLAADNPAAYERDLAGSLSNLGIRLSEAGRWSEALAATEEAVEIRRRLAADNPAAYEPDLARSLSNLGIRLSEAGRRSEALAAEQKAVEIRRRLAADNPAAYEPDLASSLSNLGIQLSEAGRRSEALAAEQKAVEIRRRLATDNPAAYEPDLARSLSNLGIRLSEAGRRSEALTATEEAVEIRRRLAADNPAAYEPDLAGSLYVLTSILAVEGELLRALRATGEAVELYRRHVDTLPSTFPLLHGVRGLQAQLFDGLGRQQEAEAVRCWLRENPLP